MKILIPMAGQGKRFVAAGYQTPKPFIEIDGMPVIEHIVKNFSETDEFVFGVNELHLQNPRFREILSRLAPKTSIIPMPYQKDGVLAVLSRMFERVRDDEPVVVNYCDFSWVWDYQHFLRAVQASSCDGAVICYQGFHPHLLGPHLYATLENDGPWMKAIREKHSWRGDKTKDWTSSGTYYFASGALLKKYCREIEKRSELKINGEFYVSQLYQLMREEDRKVFIYKIPFMLQWGTPGDLEEYLYWSGYFRRLASSKPDPSTYPMTVLLLMAGEGKRFLDAGFASPKPFIPLGPLPMFLSAAHGLPRGDSYIFAVRKDHLGRTRKALEESSPGPFSLLEVPNLTEGQACTALLAKDLIRPGSPLLIGACDHGILYHAGNFRQSISENTDADALVLTFRGFPPARRRPEIYGWVETDPSGKALHVSVKKKPSGDPLKSHAITGAFWFKKGRYFTEQAEAMISSGSRIHNEFYIDECVNFLIRKGLCVKVFEVDHYASWGTPADLKTYKYWERFFRQARFHPYGKDSL